MKKKFNLILVGPLPPPYHGQSVSFKMLADSMGGMPDCEIDLVNLADKNISGSRNSWLLGKRILDYLKVLTCFIMALRVNASRVYITIAQSRQGFMRDFLLIWIAYCFRAPIVVHLKGGNYHGFYDEQPKFVQWLIRKTLLKVERILVLGKNLLGMYDFEPLLKDKIFVVENGLPFDIAGSKRKELNKEKIELLFLSNLVESKGYLDIIEALSLLPNKDNFHINFAGGFYVNCDDLTVVSEQQAKQQFFSRINSLGLENNVTYHGVVSGEEKLDLLRKSHIFLLPTNYNNEGQPVSIIEALAFGMPIITTDYRAISDMVLPRETGYFVEYGKPKDIADAIQKICNNDTYSRMSQLCIEHYQFKFTREAHLARIQPHILGK